MPRTRTFLDIPITEVATVVKLYELVKKNNGCIDHNLKDHGIGHEHMQIKNGNIMNTNQLIHYVTVLSLYLFNIKMSGVEVDTVMKIINTYR